MLRPLPVLTAFALLALSGVAHGLWTSRWRTSDALEVACARVAQVPAAFGDWKSHDLETDPAVYAAAGAQDYWMRCYTNSRTDAAISVILMCGRSGPLSVHTPDICYRGAGFVMDHPPKNYQAEVPGAASAHFWTATFKKEQVGTSSRLRLFWTWCSDGNWQAPQWPRWTFRGEPALYKLYVIHETAGDAAPDAGVTAQFLQQFLPELNKGLFPSPFP